MTPPLIPDVGPKLEADLQAVLADVRALVAARDGLCRELAQLKTDSARQIEHMIAERDGLEAAILKAPHGLACASWADRACDCWKSDIRLGGTGAKPTVSNLIGTTSQVGYAQPLTCSTGYCSCAAKDRRIAELEAEPYLSIRSERLAQDAQWGGPDHDDRHDKGDWQRYINHQMHFGLSRRRLVKIAALAVAAIESLDRRAALDSKVVSRG